MTTMQEAVRRLTVQATSTGVTETTAKLNQLSAAQKGVTVTAQGQATATISMERRLASIQARLDPVIRQQQIMARLERDLNAARAQGLITLERQNQLLAMQSAQFAKTAATSRGFFSNLGLGAGGIGGLLGGLGVGLGVGALVQIPSAIKGIVDEASNLVDTADKIGITTKALQELKFAAGQTGVDFEQLSGSLSFFAKSLGEASRGRGELFEILKANDVPLMERLNDQLFAYADLVKNAGSSQERATLVTKAFGRSNDELINTLALGSAVLRILAGEANRTGHVLEDELLRNNEKIGDEWDKFVGGLETRFKGFILAIVDGAARGVGAIDRMANEAGNASFWDRFTTPEQRAAAQASLTPGILNYREAMRGPGADYVKSAAAGPGKKTVLPGEGDKELERLQKQFDQATLAAQRNNAALEAQASAMGLSVGAAAAYTKQQELLNTATANGLKLSPEAIANVNAIAAAYGSLTQKLEEMRTLRSLTFEAEQLGRSPTEQSIASTLRGIYGDDWQSQADGVIASQIRFNETLRVTQDLAKGFASTFVSDLRNGATAVDALTNAFSNLRDRLLDMALDIAIQKLVASLFAIGAGTGAGTGVGSSSFGGLAASIYHDGGVAGGGGATRYIHPAYFENAPRYHGGGVAGLRPNEIPAILERGERISRKGEAAGGGNVEVNVYAPPGSTVRQEQSRSGNDTKIDIFFEQMEGALAQRVVDNRSKLGSAIASTHGLRRVGR